MRLACAVTLTCVFVVTGSTAARAQARQEGRSDIAVSMAAINFDLSGTGHTSGVAARATRDLTSSVVFEVRGLFAGPEQQSGPSTMFLPEAYLLHRWTIARWTPFVGAGGGVAVIRSEFGTSWDPTLSLAGGTGIRLTDRVGLLGEMRVREVEWRFVGSIAEWALGLAWRIP